MAITSYVTFMSRLAGLSIAGVTALDEPPRQKPTANMPFSYPLVPDGEEGPLTAEGNGGWPTHKGQLVIVINPIKQNTREANYNDTVAMIDAVSAALRGTNLAQSKNTWTIRGGEEIFGDTVYWALIVTVEGKG